MCSDLTVSKCGLRENLAWTMTILQPFPSKKFWYLCEYPKVCYLNFQRIPRFWRCSRSCMIHSITKCDKISNSTKIPLRVALSLLVPHRRSPNPASSTSCDTPWHRFKIPKSIMGYYSFIWEEFLKIKIWAYSSIITIVISINLKQTEICVESY